MPKYVLNMVYKYRWLDQALDDMTKEIDFVLREYGVNEARKVEEEIRKRVLQLCRFPFSGVEYEGLLFHGKEVRTIRMNRISIIYCVQGEIVTLVAIWNNSQNPDKLLAIVKER